jgi:large subunit ribosomal protein L22
LVVKEATAGEGPTMKRMMPRARGSGSRILKRTSHIRIILTDEIEIKKRDKKAAGKKPGAKNSSKSKKSAGKVKKQDPVTEAPAATPEKTNE